MSIDAMDALRTRMNAMDAKKNAKNAMDAKKNAKNAMDAKKNAKNAMDAPRARGDDGVHSRTCAFMRVHFNPQLNVTITSGWCGQVHPISCWKYEHTGTSLHIPVHLYLS